MELKRKRYYRNDAETKTHNHAKLLNLFSTLSVNIANSLIVMVARDRVAGVEIICAAIVQCMLRIMYKALGILIFSVVQHAPSNVKYVR
jgi:hypothetical protein